MSSNNFSTKDQTIMIETVVRNVMDELAKSEHSYQTDSTLSMSSPDTRKSKSRKTMRKNKKSSTDKKKKKKKRSVKKSSNKNLEVIERLLANLENLQVDDSSTLRGHSDSDMEVPPEIAIDHQSISVSFGSSRAPSTVGTAEFYHDVARKLGKKRASLCMKDREGNTAIPCESAVDNDDDLDFEAAFGPNDMRCLALVSHNGMKATMKDFVIQHKEILKKFRLTGTNSTMKMLAEVFANEEDIVFGPSCSSGPLGGDAELVALMTSGKLGGILFFQDPMTSHPHQCDIECLVRQAVVHNTLMANTPTTALALMEVFKLALMGAGKPELIPSFFFDLQSPTVQAYKNNQSNVIQSHRS